MNGADVPFAVRRTANVSSCGNFRRMSEETVEKLLQRVEELATLPEVSMRIMQMLDDPDTEARDLQRIFEEDSALSSKLLKLANSPFYGFSREIASVERAIVLLGFNAVKALALSSSVGSMFSSDEDANGLAPNQLWTHSLAVGVAARRIFRALGRAEGDGAFLAGVMHDMGLLLEHQCLPEALSEVIQAVGRDGGDFLTAEQDRLDADHCEFGLAIADKWHFPAALANAIGYHHRPLEAEEEYQPLTCALALADNLAAQLQLGFSDLIPVEEIPAWAGDVLGVEAAALDEIRESVAEEVQSVRAAMGV